MISFRFCRFEMSLFCLFFLNIILPSSDSWLADFSFLVYVLWALDRMHILLLFYKCSDSVVGWCCWVLFPCCFYVWLLLLLLREGCWSLCNWFFFFSFLISPVGFFQPVLHISCSSVVGMRRSVGLQSLCGGLALLSLYNVPSVPGSFLALMSINGMWY